MFFSNILTKGYSQISKHSLFFLLLACALALSACGERQSVPEEENVLIYAALNPVSSELEQSVFYFNQKHEDVQIEIRDYSDEGGRERLQTELVLGQVPDIMEMHYFGSSPDRTGKNNSEVKTGNLTSWRFTGNSTLDDPPADEYWMPYRQMAQKGYLEDLWPYIENDPELGRDGLLEAPMKAAEVNGGLYILFLEIRINTVMGPESVVGNRYSWTLEELLETFASMREDSTILRYNATKRDLFFDLLCYSLDKYIDIEAGTNSFGSQEFRDLVAFLECFPDKVDAVTPAAEAEEILERVRTRRQMLEVTQIAWPEDLIRRDGFWQERAAFPGYPTLDGSSGSSFYAMGDILAMSSTCRNKEAAWEYIRRLVQPRRNKDRNKSIIAFVSTPVNRHDYEAFLWGHLEILTEDCKTHMPDNPTQFVVPWRPLGAYGPPIYPIALMTEEDLDRYENLLNSTTQLYWPEDDLSNIVWDTLGAYFAGDRTLDDTIRLIENRVGLYLQEQQ